MSAVETPAADPTPTPAPDNIIGNTGVSFNNAQLITFACHAVLNTAFVAPNPKPDWFDGLNKELQAAQDLAKQWIDDIGPDVTSSIPLQVINFNSDFQASVAAIMQIVKAHPDATGKDDPYVSQVREIIAGALVAPIETTITAVGDISTKLVTWGDGMQKAHDDLSSGATSIQKAETDLQGDIAAMNSAITNLNAMIAGENQAIAASAAAIAVGLFALVVGIALAPETGGASLVIGGAIGAAGIIGGGVTWGIMQSRINDQYREISNDQNEITADQAQIVALQGLATASSNVVSSIEAATQALSKLETQWKTFGGELQDVVAQLDQAENSLSTILQGVFTSAAQTEWAAATQTANALVNRPVAVEAKTLPMDSQQAA